MSDVNIHDFNRGRKFSDEGPTAWPSAPGREVWQRTESLSERCLKCSHSSCTRRFAQRDWLRKLNRIYRKYERDTNLKHQEGAPLRNEQLHERSYSHVPFHQNEGHPLLIYPRLVILSKSELVLFLWNESYLRPYASVSDRKWDLGRS